MKFKLFLLLSTIFLFASCNGQTANRWYNMGQSLKGTPVKELGKNIMVVYQDSKHVYWFGSWETGVYKYDGTELVNYTTIHGLINNRIDEIKEDKLGNIYFSSANASSSISKFDGKFFTTLTAIQSNNWTLDSSDMWFKYSYGNTGKVYRYDGVTLFELKLPSPLHLSNPFDIYSIYKDRKGNIWFGTNPVGVCRYNGKLFEWITEDDVTEFRNEGANGVRSITQDKNGDFWFNTEFRYSVYDSTSLNSNRFYNRYESIGTLDGRHDSNLDEYLSAVRDNNGDLWFVTYRNGVWKYDGTKVAQYQVQVNSKDITLFSIYKDNNGDLWLGTHEHGAWKFNGQKFVKFVR